MPLTSMQTLCRFALQLPDTEEGIACAGTTLESRTIKRKGKAFLFLRATEARLKLAASLPEASTLAKNKPQRFTVGAHGWVLVKLDGSGDPLDVIKRWIEESYALVAARAPKASKPRAASPKAKKKPGKAKQ